MRWHPVILLEYDFQSDVIILKKRRGHGKTDIKAGIIIWIYLII